LQVLSAQGSLDYLVNLVKNRVMNK